LGFHQFIGMVDADVMKRLAFSKKRTDELIKMLPFLFG